MFFVGLVLVFAHKYTQKFKMVSSEPSREYRVSMALCGVCRHVGLKAVHGARVVSPSGKHETT